jgi:argininosuccinate lyase
VDCHDVQGGTARSRVADALREAEGRVGVLMSDYGATRLDDTPQTEPAHAGA